MYAEKRFELNGIECSQEREFIFVFNLLLKTELKL